MDKKDELYNEMVESWEAVKMFRKHQKMFAENPKINPIALNREMQALPHRGPITKEAGLNIGNFKTAAGHICKCYGIREYPCAYSYGFLTALLCELCESWYAPLVRMHDDNANWSKFLEQCKDAIPYDLIFDVHEFVVQFAQKDKELPEV